MAEVAGLGQYVPTFAARCPGCGAQAVDRLAADPLVPIYACGSWGNRRACAVPPIRRTVTAHPVENVTSLTDADQDALGELIGRYVMAWIPRDDGVVIDCGHPECEL